jgi:hypothetical protein
MTPAKEHYEQQATEADEREYLPEDLTPVGVQVAAVPKAALAVRFDPADLDRLRERAIADGVGVTQLVRTWVLERLNDDGPGELPADLSQVLMDLRAGLMKWARDAAETVKKADLPGKARRLSK